MPQDSPAKRRQRRIKRENSLLYRMVEMLKQERDAYRNLLVKNMEEQKAAQAANKPGPEVTITKVNDDIEPIEERTGAEVV